MISLTQEVKFTLLSPNFFYNGKKINFISTLDSFEESIKSFWSNIILLMEDSEIVFENFPMIIKENMTNNIRFINISQTIVDNNKISTVLKKFEQVGEILINKIGQGNRTNKNDFLDELNSIKIENLHELQNNVIKELSGYFYLKNKENEELCIPRMKTKSNNFIMIDSNDYFKYI
jgi:hypothetical protein